MRCPCLPGLSTGVLIASITVLLVSFLYGLYELLGLIYFFSFDMLSWFSLVTGMISVMSAALALIGRSQENVQTLTWAFIWTTVSLSLATVMTGFLIIFQAEVSTTNETRALSILRIFSTYFFSVLLPLSWMAYEIREFAVLLFHETDPQLAVKRKYDEEMDWEVRQVLQESRVDDSQSEGKVRMMKMGRSGKKRSRSSARGRSERGISQSSSRREGRADI